MLCTLSPIAHIFPVLSNGLYFLVGHLYVRHQHLPTIEDLDESIYSSNYTQVLLSINCLAMKSCLFRYSICEVWVFIYSSSAHHLFSLYSL